MPLPTLVRARTLALATAVVVLGARPPGALPRAVSRSHAPCSIAVLDSRPIVLPDGRAVHLSVRNATVAGQRVFLTGTPVIIWNGERIAPDTLVGVIVDPAN